MRDPYPSMPRSLTDEPLDGRIIAYSVIGNNGHVTDNKKMSAVIGLAPGGTAIIVVDRFAGHSILWSVASRPLTFVCVRLILLLAALASCRRPARCSTRVA